MTPQVPIELVEMFRQRRVIPFLGAGFSAGHGLPDWDELLRQVSQEITDAPEYAEIKRCCNGDYLQIAEYLYLKSDKSIGPLRHKLSTLLRPSGNILDSTPHIELINLNPQQIYTTNYDEVVEETYRALKHPYASVALPKHIASSNKGKTEVVKYHGDLRFDQTLVLTESSYYNRLEFESPMDLKFRSDLLGQSVLFIGYSFRDINIRIIWFKLMEMMRDVPEADRPTSYIVRFERNEVLEHLYRAVGIRTICLDPEAKATTPAQRTQLLGDFMLSLAVKVNPNSGSLMPQADNPMFMSRGLLERLRLEILGKKETPRVLMRATEAALAYLEHASQREVHATMVADVDELLEQGSRVPPFFRNSFLSGLVAWAIRMLHKEPSRELPGACFAIIRGLLIEAHRETLIDPDSNIPWRRVWSTELSDTNTDFFVKALTSEIERHKEHQPDEDLAYVVDIAKRILAKILRTTKYDGAVPVLTDLINQASELYPSIRDSNPDPDGITDLSDVLNEIRSAMPNDDDIPF